MRTRKQPRECRADATSVDGVEALLARVGLAGWMEEELAARAARVFAGYVPLDESREERVKQTQLDRDEQA